MKVSRRKPRRRPGRPLLGREPLSARLTVMVPESMLDKIAATGNTPGFVRRALEKALAGSGHRRKLGLRGRVRRIHRF